MEKIGRHFLHKQDHWNLFANFIRKCYLIYISNVSILIANNIETWFVTDQYVEKLFESNPEEADTCTVLQALYENTNAVIGFNDTNLLILLVYNMYVRKYWNIYESRKDSWILG